MPVSSALRASFAVCCIALGSDAALAAFPVTPVCQTMIDGFEPPTGGWYTQDGVGAPILFTTQGGYTIRIDRHTITVTDPLAMNTVQHWGDPHENLNGKHIKDWEIDRRTLLLGDGTRITMHAQGPQMVVDRMSIYDGHNNVQVDNASNTITHAGRSLADTMCREREQHDGETARFTTDTITGVARYDNIYTEDELFFVTPSQVPLGSTGGHANPNQINDYYDDPRLGHT